MSPFLGLRPEQILSIVREEIEQIEILGVRNQLIEGLITPIRQRRTINGDIQGDVWLFYIVPSRREVAFAYSEEGYAMKGRSWGLAFVDWNIFGDFDSWYPSLNDLAVDSGYFELD